MNFEVFRILYFEYLVIITSLALVHHVLELI